LAGDTALLVLDDVVAGYDEVDVLRGVSLVVRAGDIVAIIGANGAGKSTLLRTVFGMVAPRAGRIRFAGAEIGGRPSIQILKSGIGYVPQGRCNFPAMTVEENLEMGAYLRRDAGVRGDIEALLARFPVLGARRGAAAGTLSGGQQQILEMAIALLLHPRLLLVDEPSLGLDPRMVEVVFATILEINREGTTVLMVEQNAKKALSVSHRGFVLELGRNRFEGSGQDLLENPDVRQHYLGLSEGAVEGPSDTSPRIAPAKPALERKSSNDGR
jgi:ABC-type branched-subunit amino acid transport system ATPase component